MFIPGQDYNGIALFQEWNKYNKKKDNNPNAKESKFLGPVAFGVVVVVWVGAVIALANFPF